MNTDKILKPGTLLIYKSHWFWKRWWYKLKKKELPYNRCAIITKEQIAYGVFDDTVILEPVKKYNTKETEMLKNTNVLSTICSLLFVKEPELPSLINAIRPNTIVQDSFTLEDLFHNKYYKQW